MTKLEIELYVLEKLQATIRGHICVTCPKKWCIIQITSLGFYYENAVTLDVENATEEDLNTIVNDTITEYKDEWNGRLYKDNA